jgi:hypothetical protein
MLDLLSASPQMVATPAPPTRDLHRTRRVRLPPTPRRSLQPTADAMNAAHTRDVGHVPSPSPRPRQAAHGLTLLALRSAYRISGLFTKYTAQRWGLRHLSNAAERVAVELIAHAVETTGNPDPNPRYTELGEVPNIGIRVSMKGNDLLIEVWDSDPAPHAYHDSHLATVGEISHRWSYYQPDTGGKVIWAELGVPSQRDAGELPQRTAGSFAYPPPDKPVNPQRDPNLLQEVLDALHRLDAKDDAP